MQAANRIVADVDRLALVMQRKVTRAIAAAALQALNGTPGPGEEEGEEI